MEGCGSAGRHIGCGVPASEMEPINQPILASRDVGLQTHRVLPYGRQNFGQTSTAARRRSSSSNKASRFFFPRLPLGLPRGRFSRVPGRGGEALSATFRTRGFVSGGADSGTGRVAAALGLGFARGRMTLAAFASILACMAAARRLLNVSSSSNRAASSSVGSTGCDRLAAGAASS